MKKKGYNIHHRRPQAQVVDESERNLVLVPIVQHEAWNTLFDGTLTPQEIADIINETWLDYEYVFIVQRRK